MQLKRLALLSGMLSLLFVAGWSVGFSAPVGAVPARAVYAQAVLTHTLFLPLVAHRPPPPAPAAPPDDWLAALNYYRGLAGLPPVAGTAAFLPPGEFPGMVGVDPNAACRQHARYMVKTQTATHYEDPASPWYTDAGNTAGASSVLTIVSDVNTTDGEGVRQWIDAPFHLVSVFGLAATHAAFGGYREQVGAYNAAFALTVFHADRRQYPTAVNLPVTFPRDGGYTPVLEFWGEHPNPLGYCPGYSAPAGPPIWIAFGHPHITGRYIQRLDTVSFVEDGQARDFCLLQCTAGDARAYLCTYEHVMLIPRRPLTPGHHYTASITVTFAPLCDQVDCGAAWTETHAWSFSAVRFD